jgi:hypothetical protein
MRNSGTSTAPCTRSGGDDQPGGAAAEGDEPQRPRNQGPVLVRMRTTMLSGHRSGYQEPRIPMAAVRRTLRPTNRGPAVEEGPGHRSHSPVMAPAVLTPPGASWLADIRLRELGEAPAAVLLLVAGSGGLPCQPAQTLSSPLRFLYHSTDIVRNACRLALWGEEGGDDRREPSASAPGRRRGR